MLCSIVVFAYFFGAIAVSYPALVTVMFVIYKMTGGKRGFRAWWSLMKYQI